MNDRPENPDMPEEPPMVPPPPPPPVAGTVALDSEREVRTGGIGGRIVAGALGLVLLVGGVAFAATQVANDDGAGSPEDAVAEMFDAIADEDVLGLLATLDPRERDALSQPVEDLFEQLERLEVLDDSFELSGVQGVDLEFEDLGFRSEPVRDDLARVYLTGGTASFAVNTDEIPIGDFLADSFERFGVEYQGIQESDSDSITGADADDTFVVARKTDDGWRVSLGYTAVEAARVELGRPVPAAGAGIAPAGADSPEEAVEGFLRAAVGVDIEGALARLSPGELGAVHDYWPALVGDADLPSRDDIPAQIELTDLELRSTTEGDRGRVFIDSIGLDFVTEHFEGGATVADGCVEIRGDIRSLFEDQGFELPDGPICQDDIETILEELGGELGGMGMLGFGGMEGLALDAAETPELAITVVRIDGGWFVAPIGTYIDLGLAVLETLEREHLDSMVDAVEEFVGSGFFSGAGLGGGFMPPGMTEELEGLEELEELDETETSSGPFDDGGETADVDTVLGEMLRVFTTDADVAACTLEELHATASTDQLHELADAYEHQYEPSVGAQGVLFSSLSACGG